MMQSPLSEKDAVKGGGCVQQGTAQEGWVTGASSPGLWKQQNGVLKAPVQHPWDWYQ